MELVSRSRSSILLWYQVDWWPEKEAPVRLCRTFLRFKLRNGGDSRRTTTADLQRRKRRVDWHRWRAEPTPDDGVGWRPTPLAESIGEEKKEKKKKETSRTPPSFLSLFPKMPPQPFILKINRKLKSLRHNFYILNTNTTSKISINSPKRSFRLTRKKFLITSSFYVYSFKSRIL